MIAAKLRAAGVRCIFGIPGGGSSLDLIEAAARAGIAFYLARREDSAVMMAAVTAELSGTPGVTLVGLGPGTANAANGVAYAALDRAPLLLFTDGYSPAQRRYVSHQAFDQQAMLAPVAKGYGLLDGEDPAGEFNRLLELAGTPPFGPVQIELTSEVALRTVPQDGIDAGFLSEPVVDQADIDRAAALLAQAERPVMIAGLEACDRPAAEAVRRLVDRLHCPVLVTYKAKGVVADRHPCHAGIFTGGTAEQPIVSEADLILLVGLDPVELIARPWAYDCPVLDIARIRHEPHYMAPVAGLYGPLDAALASLLGSADHSGWRADDIADLKREFVARLAFPSNAALNPQTIVELAQAAAGQHPRVAIDAGAHMISATTFWQASDPRDLLISNGLSTMGFAIPAAIAAALEDRARGAIALIGDGGFMMCASELTLAAQEGLDLVTVIFNDSALSLIDIKQQGRGLDQGGTRWPRLDLAQVSRGYGCRAWQVDTVEAYQKALEEAFAGKGPAVIDVIVDPTGYQEQLAALRG